MEKLKSRGVFFILRDAFCTFGPIASHIHPSITVDAGKDNVTMNLFNPEGNPCYFTFEIVLSDTGETIYKSDMVEPGKAITNVKLQHPLATGEHNAVIKISTASLTDGKTMNGANVETVLVAK